MLSSAQGWELAMILKFCHQKRTLNQFSGLILKKDIKSEIVKETLPFFTFSSFVSQPHHDQEGKRGNESEIILIT